MTASEGREKSSEASGKLNKDGEILRERLYESDRENSGFRLRDYTKTYN
jgi:hypothetical protein